MLTTTTVADAMLVSVDYQQQGRTPASTPASKQASQPGHAHLATLGRHSWLIKALQDMTADTTDEV
jgi:hypothetical protein